MLHDAEFWYGVGFVIFVAIVLYVGSVKLVTGNLDERGRRIAAELAEAERLRAEAQAIVAEYEAKRSRADAEAAEIVATAQAEAERAAAEASTRLTDFVARRTATAETKIAQAEAQAVADVRSAAADAAIAAAGQVLRDSARGATAERLLDAGLQEVRQKLH